MNQPRIHVMDDLGRVLIPYELRSEVGVDIGDRFTALANLQNKTITLLKYQPWRTGSRRDGEGDAR
jgi:bifunctional DNA-binding transcriptional regulator/antitoxin component of YhaV-PrlF toxin-antitoxin module